MAEINDWPSLWILRDKYKHKKTRLPLKDQKLLARGYPLDYLIGWKPFLNCQIDLSFKPLIPRPETEYWAEKAIEEIKKNPEKRRQRVLDIFAGSGCVGIAVLKNTKNTLVDFAEKNDKFLKQIEKNLILNKITNNRWKLIKSDVWQRVENKYDFILANPPYIAVKKKPKLPLNVKKYEPSAALFGGKEGMIYIKKFLFSLKKYLNQNGQAWLEFDAPQKAKIEKLLKKNNFRNWLFKKDQFGRWRWVIIFS